MNRNYLAKRVAQAAFTVWAVVTITFGMIRLLPGNARDFMMAVTAGQGAGSTQARMDAEGIEAPSGALHEQYIDYVTAVANGDLGTSVFHQEPVLRLLVERVPWTVFVITVALVLTYVIGIALGAVMAYREGTRFDLVTSTLSTFLNSIPYYVMAIVLVYVLGYQWRIFPATGRKPDYVDPGLTVEFVSGVLTHAALPVASIVIAAFGFRALAMRGNSIQVLGEEYVRVADLRGLPDRRIALQYVGRNAVLPMYTELMIAIGALLGGSIVIEYIFEYKGMGFLFHTGLAARDYPLVMGCFLVISIIVALGLFAADLTYGLIDPRASTTEGGDGSQMSLRARVAAFAGTLRRFRANVSARLFGGHDRRTRGGGNPDSGPDASLFETTSNVNRTRRERYRRSFREYVVAPARIMWKDVRARVGVAIMVLFLLVGTVGVRLVPPPRDNQAPRMLGAFQDLSHPLGSTVTGSDVLSHIVHATPPMLEMMAAGAVFATLIATTIGIVAGYLRGRVDQFLMLLSDIALTIPALPLVLVLVVVFEPTRPAVVGVLATVNAWGGTARQIRSQVLATGQEEYVEASGIMALSLPNIMTKDILPNIAPFVMVRFVWMARQVIVLTVAVYFLGFLAAGPPNWGIVLRDAYNNGGLLTFDLAHWILAPVVTIAIFIYGMILFAQGTDRIFNPQIRARALERGRESGEEDAGGPVTAVGDD